MDFVSPKVDFQSRTLMKGVSVPLSITPVYECVYICKPATFGLFEK